LEQSIAPLYKETAWSSVRSVVDDVSAVFNPIPFVVLTIISIEAE
jgi:hypothetical protein